MNLMIHQIHRPERTQQTLKKEPTPELDLGLVQHWLRQGVDALKRGDSPKVAFDEAQRIWENRNRNNFPSPANIIQSLNRYGVNAPDYIEMLINRTYSKVSFA